MPKKNTELVEDTLLVGQEMSAGTVSISENVFASIISKYTLEIPEVIAFAHKSFVGGLVEMIGKKPTDRAVRVDIEDDCVQVTVNIAIEFGKNIPTVAEKVQNVIRREVEKVTGKSVAQVNVIVSDLMEMEKATELESAKIDMTTIHT